MCLSKTVWCCNKIFSSAEEPDLDFKSVLESSAHWPRVSQRSSSVKLNAINSRFKAAQVSSRRNSKRKIHIIKQARGFSDRQTKQSQCFCLLVSLCCCFPRRRCRCCFSFCFSFFFKEMKKTRMLVLKGVILNPMARKN